MSDQNTQATQIRRDADEVSTLSLEKEIVKDLAPTYDAEQVRGGAAPLDSAPVK